LRVEKERYFLNDADGRSQQVHDEDHRSDEGRNRSDWGMAGIQE
jgi:hypothetical protein